MGLFGSILHGIGKVVGGVAKAGLNVATHGASDKLLSVLKSSGTVKKVAAQMTSPTAVPTLKNTIAVAKRAPLEGAPGINALAKGIQKTNDYLYTSGFRTRTAAAPTKAPARLVYGNQLDFKAMSAAWHKAGEPSTWQEWIKKFPLYMKSKKATIVGG